MKEGWKMVKLEDVSNLITDGDWIESKNQSSEGIRLIQTGNIGPGFFKDKSDSYRYISETTFTKLNCTEIFKGDCLVSRLPDPVGRACIIPDTKKRMITAVDCSILRFNSAILPKWFIYYSQSNEYYSKIDKESTGSTRKRISRKNLTQITIPLPPLEEQHRIVSILDATFEKIDTLKANAEENLKNAKALFQQVLAQELKPKEDWVEKKIGDVCEVINGRAYKQSELLDKGKYKVLRVGNFFTNNNWYYSDLELDENKYCDNGDLLYAWSASFGPKIWKGDKVIYHYHIWKMLCSDYIDKYFMFYYLNSTLFIQKALKDLHGTTMSHITKGIMESTIVAFPSISEQQRIVQTLDTLSEKCRHLETIAQQTIRECDALKQSILRQAFSGEL